MNTPASTGYNSGGYETSRPAEARAGRFGSGNKAAGDVIGGTNVMCRPYRTGVVGVASSRGLAPGWYVVSLQDTADLSGRTEWHRHPACEWGGLDYLTGETPVPLWMAGGDARRTQRLWRFLCQ